MTEAEKIVRHNIAWTASRACGESEDTVALRRKDVEDLLNELEGTRRESARLLSRISALSASIPDGAPEESVAIRRARRKYEVAAVRCELARLHRILLPVAVMEKYGLDPCQRQGNPGAAYSVAVMQLDGAREELVEVLRAGV